MTKALPEKKRGRPLMLGAIDIMVQDYLKAWFPFITCFCYDRNYYKAAIFKNLILVALIYVKN